MQSSICKQLGKKVIYPSPMHIIQRCIAGYDIPDNHEKLRSLNVEGRVAARKFLHNEMQFQAGTYVYRSMKLVGEHGCILAAHQFR
jgi:hypothetical protein